MGDRNHRCPDCHKRFHSGEGVISHRTEMQGDEETGHEYLARLKGMTLRDYAMIKFIAAIVGNEESHKRSVFYAEKNGRRLKDQITYDAGGLADAMPKERVK